MLLHGVVPPIATPLTASDRVDEPGLRRLARYLLNARVHALFANGSMGGFAFLTADEQVRSIGITVSEANGRVPVIGGLGETSSSRATPLARRIESEGVDFICVLPPFYYLASQRHLINYFCDIAAVTDKPLILYDNPILTKNPIEVESVEYLLDHIPHLAAIKVSDSDQAKLQAIIRISRKHEAFSVFTGHEFLLVSGLQMGCSGVVGGIHNVCPHLAVALYEAFLAGDLESATTFQEEIIATWQILRHGSIWGAFDEALRFLGICERATGMPYVTELGPEERTKVHGILDKHVKPYLMEHTPGIRA